MVPRGTPPYPGAPAESHWRSPAPPNPTRFQTAAQEGLLARSKSHSSGDRTAAPRPSLSSTLHRSSSSVSSSDRATYRPAAQAGGPSEPFEPCYFSDDDEEEEGDPQEAKPSTKDAKKKKLFKWTRKRDDNAFLQFEIPSPLPLGFPDNRPKSKRASSVPSQTGSQSSGGSGPPPPPIKPAAIPVQVASRAWVAPPLEPRKKKGEMKEVGRTTSNPSTISTHPSQPPPHPPLRRPLHDLGGGNSHRADSRAADVFNGYDRGFSRPMTRADEDDRQSTLTTTGNGSVVSSSLYMPVDISDPDDGSSDAEAVRHLAGSFGEDSWPAPPMRSRAQSTMDVPVTLGPSIRPHAVQMGRPSGAYPPAPLQLLPNASVPPTPHQMPYPNPPYGYQVHRSMPRPHTSSSTATSSGGISTAPTSPTSPSHSGRPAAMTGFGRADDGLSTKASARSSRALGIDEEGVDERFESMSDGPSEVAGLELPPFPCKHAETLALTIHRGPLLRHAGSTGTFRLPSRQWRPWRSQLVSITKLPSGVYHLHAFAGSSPDGSALETGRLRLKPGSIVCVLEESLDGEMRVLKVTGSEGSASRHAHAYDDSYTPTSTDFPSVPSQRPHGRDKRHGRKREDASGVGGNDAAWIFAMDGPDQLKAWMSTLKGIVAELRDAEAARAALSPAQLLRLRALNLDEASAPSGMFPPASSATSPTAPHGVRSPAGTLEDGYRSIEHDEASSAPRQPGPRPLRRISSTGSHGLKGAGPPSDGARSPSITSSSQSGSARRRLRRPSHAHLAASQHDTNTHLSATAPRNGVALITDEDLDMLAGVSRSVDEELSSVSAAYHSPTTGASSDGSAGVMMSRSRSPVSFGRHGPSPNSDSYHTPMSSPPLGPGGDRFQDAASPGSITYRTSYFTGGGQGAVAATSSPMSPPPTSPLPIPPGNASPRSNTSSLGGQEQSRQRSASRGFQRSPAFRQALMESPRVPAHPGLATRNSFESGVLGDYWREEPPTARSQRSGSSASSVQGQRRERTSTPSVRSGGRPMTDAAAVDLWSEVQDDFQEALAIAAVASDDARQRASIASRANSGSPHVKFAPATAVH